MKVVSTTHTSGGVSIKLKLIHRDKKTKKNQNQKKYKTRKKLL